MTHRACRSRARTGQITATGPVTSTCLHDRWGRVEATQTALGEALAIRRRTRVRFPPPPPLRCRGTPFTGVSRHRSRWGLWLVVPGRVEGQVAQQVSAGGEQADV